MGRLIDIDVLFDYFGNDAIDKTTRSNIEYFVSEKGTVKAIPKADYENRLKADMVAVLEELRLSIEELDYPKDCDYACNGCLYWGDVDNVIQQKINELPSVAPQEPRWIPVSEKLPNSDDEVLCWYEYYHWSQEKVLPEYGIGRFFKEMKLWIGEVSSGKDVRVIAWMPLPKPYEPQESEDV